MLLVDYDEQLRSGGGAFCASEQQESSGPERVVKDREHVALCGVIQIDEQIAATDQVEVREGRIPGDVMTGEDATFPYALVDLVSSVDLGEEAP